MAIWKSLTVLFSVGLILIGGTTFRGYSAGTGEQPVLSEFTLRSAAGDVLPAGVIGTKLYLQTLLEGQPSQKYSAILELRDEKQVTSAVLTHELVAGLSGQETIQFQWTPDTAGKFSGRIYILSSAESPELLAHLESDVAVAASQAELDAMNPKAPVPPEPIPVPSDEPSGPAGYTFMVYMVASNLESEGYYATEDIKEMMKVGSTKNVNVIIETGGSANSTKDNSRFIDFTKVQRFQVLKGDVKPIADLGTQNMASSRTLSNFVDWGTKSYPAERYAIILWDHGAGILGFGHDDIFDDTLDLGELGDGLYPIKQQGKQFELVGFDACLMASIEVAYSVGSAGKYMVASEELEPAWGMDFEAILSSLDADPAQDGAQLGKTISDSYMSDSHQRSVAFSDYGADRELTMSVVDLSKVPALYKEASALGDYLDKLGGDTEITHTLAKTIRETERYGEAGKSSTGHLDLYNMAQNIDKEFPKSMGVGQKVQKQVDEAIVYSLAGDTHQDSHGISIFMQVEQYEPNAPYLRFIVGRWIGVLTTARQSLDQDVKPPDISFTMRNDGTLYGKVEGIDLDLVSTYVTQEDETNRYQLKIPSIVYEDASDFVKPNAMGFMSYNWSRSIASLCNGDDKDCKPTTIIYSKNGKTKFAYTEVRLESDRFNGTLWLIYSMSQGGTFDFLGGWPGVDEDGNAQRELVPLLQGDRVYSSTYLLKYSAAEDKTSFEPVEASDPIIVGEAFGPSMHRYPGQYSLVFSACDFSGNCSFTDQFDYEVK